MGEIYRSLFLTTAFALMLYPLYAYWKIHGVYKLLGDRVSKSGFLWFSFQFQNPTFSRGMRSYVDYFDALPDDLKARVVAVRRQLRYNGVFIICWIGSVLCFGWLTSLLGSHPP